MCKSDDQKYFSKTGYVIVAAGAAVGLGNIWKFPYLAYRNGGGAFITIYLVLFILLAIPLVKAESAIGRRGRVNAVKAYEVGGKRWKIVGFISVLFTFMVNMYYIVVGGWVMRYDVSFLLGESLGANKQAYYDNYISTPLSPIIYAGILLVIITVVLCFGFTGIVEKINSVIMPMLVVFLGFCGAWALIYCPNALGGLAYYLRPDWGKCTMTTFADACTQVLFSIGAGGGLYVTLGASVKESADLRRDAWNVGFFDTFVAILAGFAMIPTVVGSKRKMVGGPGLAFVSITEILEHFPFGRIIGIFFFTSLLFAVISSFFSLLEIPARFVQETFEVSRSRATIVTAAAIFAGSIFCSLSKGMLSDVCLPWFSVSGISYLDIFSWVDAFTGSVLLPIGVILLCVYVVYVWGFDNYEEELSNHGKLKKLGLYEKMSLIVICPLITLFVVLHSFGIV